MQWLNSILLIGIGVLLALGNVWFAAARSTIPVAVDDRIKSVERRHEKHPGKDDVFLLHLESGSVLQVDEHVAKELREGDRLDKVAWSRSLNVDARIVQLTWSADYHGMVIAMPAILLVIIASACSKECDECGAADDAEDAFSDGESSAATG